MCHECILDRQYWPLILSIVTNDDYGVCSRSGVSESKPYNLYQACREMLDSYEKGLLFIYTVGSIDVDHTS